MLFPPHMCMCVSVYVLVRFVLFHAFLGRDQRFLSISGRIETPVHIVPPLSVGTVCLQRCLSHHMTVLGKVKVEEPHFRLSAVVNMAATK